MLWNSLKKVLCRCILVYFSLSHAPQGRVLGKPPHGVHLLDTTSKSRRRKRKAKRVTMIYFHIWFVCTSFSNVIHIKWNFLLILTSISTIFASHVCMIAYTHYAWAFFSFSAIYFIFLGVGIGCGAQLFYCFPNWFSLIFLYFTHLRQRHQPNGNFYMAKQCCCYC